jgi:hypothetical protein
VSEIIESERVKKGKNEGQSNFAFFFLTKKERQFMYRHRERGRKSAEK